MRMDYSGISDEELISRYREGENDICDYLLDKYKNLVRGKASSMYLLGGETQDLIQEGMIGLFQAIRDYDYGRDASFFTFADLCVSRKMYTAVKAANGQKHFALNTYVSIYENDPGSMENGDSKAVPLYETLPGKNNLDPEQQILSMEIRDCIDDAIALELSQRERETLELHMTGVGSPEIARILGLPPKVTDNALQRAKNKLLRILRAKGLVV